MKKYFSFIIVFTLLFAACSKDDDGGYAPINGFDGSIEAIRDFVGADLLDSIVGLGMVIHTGNKPPNIEGEFLAEHILVNSNVPGDFDPGKRFPNLHMEFTNMNGLEIDFNSKQGSSTTVGNGSLISGKGKFFTVFLKVEVELNGKTANMIEIISGRIKSEGIYDYKFANFMIDNRGNHPQPFIPNGTGRLMEDNDGVAERL